MNALPFVSESITRARSAQASWRNTSVSSRLEIVRSFRWKLAERCEEMAATAVSETHPLHEVFVSEVFPLLEACRFLERKASALLKPRNLGADGRPWWLWGLESRICREPFGVIGRSLLQITRCCWVECKPFRRWWPVMLWSGSLPRVVQTLCGYSKSCFPLRGCPGTFDCASRHRRSRCFTFKRRDRQTGFYRRFRQWR
jgi:hypothetical protein